MSADHFWYLGRQVRQHAAIAEVFPQLFAKERFDRILELGSADGGLAVWLADRLPNTPIISYDLNAPVAAAQSNISFRIADILAVPAEITDHITQSGRTLVLCDNGNKPAEFRAYAAFLKPGDAIMAHDLGFSDWPWYEINEADVAPACQQYQLQPFHAERMRSVAWLSRWKPWSAPASSGSSPCIPSRLHECGSMAVKRCRHGAFLYNIHDTFIGRSLDLYGEWCGSELDVLRGCLQPGDVVVDVGANLGTHTVALAQHVGRSGFVFAIEPQRLVFQTLCANVALNGLPNVCCLELGVGASAGMAQVPVPRPDEALNVGAISLLGQQQGEPVRVVRLDDLNLPRCRLIKIDVEGMEADVLAGARQTIAQDQPLLFVENNTVERSAAVLEAIQTLGYHAAWHIAPYFSPRNFFGNPVDVFARFQPEANLLCAPQPLSAPGLEPARLGDDWQIAWQRIRQRTA